MTQLKPLPPQKATPLSGAVFNKELPTVQGGRFELGFISAFTSSLALSYTTGKSNDPFAIMGIGAAIGGTAESLGGGKFANGAITGAFVALFNHGMHLEELQEVTDKKPGLINLKSETAGQDLINLMEKIEKSNMWGDINDVIDLSDFQMIEGETNRQFDNSYDGHYAKITVINTNGSNDYYQVGYRDYAQYGSTGYGVLSIKGQFDIIVIKISSQNSYNKAYEQIFGK